MDLPFDEAAARRVRGALEFPSLPRQRSAREVVRLWVGPSFHPWVYWVLHEDEGEYFVRRLVWRPRRTNPTTHEQSFCAEGRVPMAEADELRFSLAALSIQPFTTRTVVVLDGTRYGFETVGLHPAMVSWWGAPPEGVRPASAWMERAVNVFQSLLPASTLELPPVEFGVHDE